MLIDNSQSMAISDGTQQKTKFFESFQEQISDQISSDYNIETFNFAATLEGNDNSTNLQNSLQVLQTKYSATEIDEIFLLSDGWFKDDNYDFLKKLNIPINTIIPNIKNNFSDISITDIRNNETAYHGDICPIEIRVNAMKFAGNATLLLKINNQDYSTKTLDFSKDSFQKIIFEVKFSQLGLNTISAEISAPKLTETDLANKKLETAIKIDDKRNKILIISDKLTWDIKFLIDAIKTDAKLEAEFLLKDNVLYKNNVPTNLSKHISDSKVIFILNNDKLRFNNFEFKLIANYQKNGGSLVFMGNYLDQFAEILPSKKSEIHTEFESTILLSDASKKYQTFNFEAEQIPPLKYKFIRPKIESEVLAVFANEQRSAAILINNGHNKIMQLAMKNLWRWQMHSKESSFTKFIVDICNWMSSNSKNNFVSFTNKNSYFLGENVKLELIAYDEKLNVLNDLNAKLELKKSDEIILTKYLENNSDRYSTIITELKAGKYFYSIIDDKTKQKTAGEFIVRSDSGESRDVGINRSMLSYISKTTNGKTISDDNIDQLEFSAKMKEYRVNHEIPIYKKKWLILLFLTSFCLELFFRKRWGML
ncbi:MAG: hypothetical protein KAS49_03010 [Candidatus Cloacimonetes bacterium]|nr:hypothetical protein [Candidatus Cloacimonadota bacterium]